MSGTEGQPSINHIIGHTRTIQTAVLVVEYLRRRCGNLKGLHGDMFEYRFKNPTSENGNWSADIIVVTHATALDLEVSSKLCETCRAFVAGRGEVWT